MKIRTYYSDKLPKGKHHIEWIKMIEYVTESAYLIRSDQNRNSNNWFRNMKVIAVDEVSNFHGTGTYKQYTIEYEAKKEYWEADIPSSALAAILRNNPELGVMHHDGYLWLEYIGQD